MKDLNMISGIESPSHSTNSTLRKRQDAPKSSLLTDPSLSNTLAWGRTGNGRSWLGSLIASLPGALAPLSSICVFITFSEFNGCLSEFLAAGMKEGFWPLFKAYGPQPSLKGTIAWSSWIVLQAALFQWLPGPINTGQPTPAGHVLTYRTNGLYAWIVTHTLYAALCWFGFLDPGFIPRNWSGLFAAMNLSGFVVSSFAYVKAHLMPTHADDRKFSGSAIYDFYMGIELNPRIGQNFDFKLFSNGRPGMIAWTLIPISNLAYQYQVQQRMEPSLILITILQVIYVLDFFVNESWYLRTIDIAHDHYGFYLSWGCFCFLPTTYTIQAQYLGLYPQSPPALYMAIVFSIGLAGYIIFRSVNDQKDRVRRTGGKCLIWGKPAEYITATYTTTNGEEHKSILLCSGWWGLSRHANYVGDLFLSYSMCALVGTTKGLVWFYAIWMTMLLIHRCKRDEQRCSGKYGADWEEYCRRVPWRFIPGVW